MIKSAVTIALVPEIKKGPWIFWEDLEKSIKQASKLGFDAIELFTPDAGAIDTNQLRTMLLRENLTLAAVGTGAGKVLHGLTLTDPDPQVRASAIHFIQAMMQFGAAFGAPAIIGSMQGNNIPGTDPALTMAWLCEGLKTLDEFAGSLGTTLIYEPLNRYETNLINTLGDAATFINRNKIIHTKLLADLFHMNIEEADPAESIRVNMNLIGHVHFADSNRRPIGNGHINMQSIANTLIELQYPGFVSAEAFPWPDPEAAARQTIKAFRQYFPSHKNI